MAGCWMICVDPAACRNMKPEMVQDCSTSCTALPIHSLFMRVGRTGGVVENNGYLLIFNHWVNRQERFFMPYAANVICRH